MKLGGDSTPSPQAANASRSASHFAIQRERNLCCFGSKAHDERPLVEGSSTGDRRLRSGKLNPIGERRPSLVSACDERYPLDWEASERIHECVRLVKIKTDL